MSVFARFAPRLQQAIVARLGWTSLRPVQEEAGEALLRGDNAVVLAPTAGGKTEASMFPTLSAMVDDPPSGIGALYIAPIKALLNNQAERLGLYTEMVGMDRFVWHGDTSTAPRKKFLREPTELLMTTPESLEVMLVSQTTDTGKLFSDLRVVVIDEIHALAGSDRGAHLMSVIERLAKLSRHDVQRVGLSATVGNPEEISSWLQGSSKRGATVVDPPKSPAKRELLLVHRPELDELALEASKRARGQKSLFFCQSRSVAEAVAEKMARAQITVFVHHSAVSREERALAEEKFHRGGDACIVCTSTLELGIDVGDLDRVLQAEAPTTVGAFLQRMGRTGRRAGKSANTSFYCETTEGMLQALALVELARAGWVESVAIEGRCWPVVVHQLMTMSLAEQGITLDAAWAHLSALPDTRQIQRGEFERLVRWMLADGGLRMASGLLVLGPKAEKRFGRRNFMELFAVFSSPQSYTVTTMQDQPLGTLNQEFVDRLVEDVSCFLLGGKPWAVHRVLHGDRKVMVSPAPKGRQPTWGGFLPQMLGHELCQAIREVAVSETVPPWLDADASHQLEGYREQMRPVLLEEDGLEVEPSEIRWWTFAGGRINATLRYALEALEPDWKVIPDNFLVKVRGESVTTQRFRAALARLEDLELWESPEVWAHVAKSLPNYRLSKFQAFMPPWLEREMVASYLLDVSGTWSWLTGQDATIDRIPKALHALTPEDQLAIAWAKELDADAEVLKRDPARRLVYVSTPAALETAVEALLDAERVGLDVETHVATRALCLIQIADATTTYLIDALALSDLSPLKPLLEGEVPTKLIHNARFERSVLSRHDFELDGVIDTLETSRQRRGRDIVGGHSLKSCCLRELKLTLDKSQQTSAWQQRPLTPEQVEYAALDAEILLTLHDVLTSEPVD